VSANRLTPTEHETRAARHDKIGRLLGGATDEWCAVPIFYAAYHLVKAALLTDPVFGDPKKLAVVNSALTPDDRNVTRHTGDKKSQSNRCWGVNDLVFMLYYPQWADYIRLHQASIDVRYKLGLTVGVANLLRALDQITAAYEEGEMRYA
jgi:hypothetical protein